ncbi:hypothetical protein AS156_27745 [Bradyrhizobium macuxiense]|uniref:SF3 helicase domain-containing protein n=2 Tax=Bradyrhizobium macuxiense TaxID=1755647 RepID=A0A109K551_9BRAD|nr:hypothetical protein AS156_27745 [Bradyrhizobium macuxiense]
MHSTTAKPTDNVILHDFAANDNQREIGAGVSPTEDGVAKVFANVYRDQLRYCHTAGAWHEWTGQYWKRDEKEIALHYARLMAREMSKGTNSPRTLASIRKRSFARGVEGFAQGEPILARTFEDWDRDPFLLGTPDGTVDLRTGKLREADPADGITKITSVSPSDAEDCRRWLQFLAEAMNDDKEKIRFLKQWTGYCLSGDTREQKLVFAYGPGGNGKGMYVNTVKHIMNDYAVVASMETFTASKWDRHPTDLAMLRGARLVTASETEQGRAWAESRIKSLTGGDPITARFMRENFFTYMPQFKLTIIGNHQPSLHSVDEANRRRFMIVPFTHTPAKKDLELDKKLISEAPGILRWAINGYLDWQREGLVRPKSIAEATEAYFAEQDVFGQWLSDCCRVDIRNRSVSEFAADLFESWAKYAEAAGEHAGTAKSFGQELVKRGFERKRTQHGAMYIGVQVSRPAASNDA